MVILTSLLAASFGLPRLLRGLVLPGDATEEASNESKARQEAANAAIAAVEAARRAPLDPSANPDAYTEAAGRVVGLYQHRLLLTAPRGNSDGQLHRVAEAERALRLEGLKAERDTIYSLARQRQISDATSRKLVREIDLQESRYRAEGIQ
jgi:CPA1 family monovalent cation:H+ antiporter